MIKGGIFYEFGAVKTGHNKDDMAVFDSGDHLHGSYFSDYDCRRFFHRKLCREGRDCGGQSGTSNHLFVSWRWPNGFHWRRGDCGYGSRFWG